MILRDDKELYEKLEAIGLPEKVKLALWTLMMGYDPKKPIEITENEFLAIPVRVVIKDGHYFQLGWEKQCFKLTEIKIPAPERFEAVLKRIEKEIFLPLLSVFQGLFISFKISHNGYKFDPVEFAFAEFDFTGWSLEKLIQQVNAGIVKVDQFYSELEAKIDRVKMLKAEQLARAYRTKSGSGAD